jgi:hypothetical protein
MFIPTVSLKWRRKIKRTAGTAGTAGTASTAAASAASTAKSISTRIKPIPVFLHVADYIISFTWQSFCGKRAGSHIILTKTKTELGFEPTPSTHKSSTHPTCHISTR